MPPSRRRAQDSGMPDAGLARYKSGASRSRLYTRRVARFLIHLIIAVVTSKRPIINVSHLPVSISALRIAASTSSPCLDLFGLRRRIRLLWKTSTFVCVLHLDFSPSQVRVSRRHWIRSRYGRSYFVSPPPPTLFSLFTISHTRATSVH